jgi:hypothetical protein
MKVQPIHSLATLDSGCGDIRLVFENLELVLQYEFGPEGADQVGKVRFVGVVAFRFRNELHSAGFVDGSYDQVVEIVPSEWLTELKTLEPAGFSGLTDKRHFAVLLSSNGYLEVIAEQMEPEKAIRGLLADCESV